MRTPDMTRDQKIIRAKVGLLELAKQLGTGNHENDVVCHQRKNGSEVAIFARIHPILNNLPDRHLVVSHCRVRHHEFLVFH
jgi:hypothetical protein